nr:hypothetical protein [Tanacetum cinerariifolium]
MHCTCASCVSRSLGESILAIGEDFASSGAILSLKSCCKLVGLANLASQVGWGSGQEGFLGKLLSGDGEYTSATWAGKIGIGGTLLWRRGVLLLMLTNNGWVDGNGSNPSGRFRKPGGGQVTRGGEDGLEGPGGQLSMNSRKDGASLSLDDEEEEEITEEETVFFPFSLLGFLEMSRGSMTFSWIVNLVGGTMA